jgi:hypothetical protein
MYSGIKGAILAGAVVVVLGGCSPISEPWDSTGKFEEERTQSEELQEQLRHRAAHTQRGV